MITEEKPEPDYSPKPLTAAQTIRMTVVILLAAGGVLGLLWLLIRAKG